MEYRLGTEHGIYTMDPACPPVLWMKSGDTVDLECGTWDDGVRDYARELSLAEGGLDINPATGPVGVREARPGDTLALSILDLEVRDQGLMFVFPGSGLSPGETEVSTLRMNRESGLVRFPGGIGIPAAPMIGVIGTAPPEPVPCYLPGRHGGNMDCRLVKAGSTVYLPVFVPGGGFSVGDLHGAMADGEVSEWGLETCGRVRIRAEVLPGARSSWPVVETPESFSLVVSRNSLEEAIREAVEILTDRIRRIIGLSSGEALSLISLAGNVEICQVVNPLKTIRVRFLKNILGISWREVLLPEAETGEEK